MARGLFDSVACFPAATMFADKCIGITANEQLMRNEGSAGLYGILPVIVIKQLPPG